MNVIPMIGKKLCIVKVWNYGKILANVLCGIYWTVRKSTKSGCNYRVDTLPTTVVIVEINFPKPNPSSAHSDP